MGTKHHSLDVKLQRPCLDPTEPCNSSDDPVTGAQALVLQTLQKGFGFIAITITTLHLMASECIFSHYKYTLNCREANFPLFSQGFHLGLIIKLTQDRLTGRRKVQGLYSFMHTRALLEKYHQQKSYPHTHHAFIRDEQERQWLENRGEGTER